LEAVKLAGLCAAALCAGTIDAIAGGGGLITVPALRVVGIPVDVVLGTNKGQSTFGSLSALVNFWRGGKLDRARLPVAFAGGFLGALGGARLVLQIPRAVLQVVVVVLLAAVAAVVLFRRSLGVHEDAPPPPDPLVRTALIATAIGFYDGFFGPGTGTFLIMAFVAWMNDSLTRATANAKVVNFASNVGSLVVFAIKGRVLWEVALPMAAAQFAGGALGARLAVRYGNRFVRGVLLAVVASLLAKLLWDLLASR
jgi:uncharacterized membrane protein YfcA